MAILTLMFGMTTVVVMRLLCEMVRKDEKTNLTYLKRLPGTMGADEIWYLTSLQTGEFIERTTALQRVCKEQSDCKRTATGPYDKY